MGKKEGGWGEEIFTRSSYWILKFGIQIFVKECSNINQKQVLKDKLNTFELKSNNRFELADKFIKDSKQAKIIASKENPEGIRDFIKKIGSNFQIQNQNISFSPRGAWQIVAKSALSVPPAGGATAPQVRKTSENSEIVNWRCAFEKIRTDFAQNL